MVIETQWVLQGGLGLLVALVGWLLKRVLDRVLEDLHEVKEATKPLPGMEVRIGTVEREMGERKAWEREHLNREHPRIAAGD